MTHTPAAPLSAEEQLTHEEWEGAYEEVCQANEALRAERDEARAALLAARQERDALRAAAKLVAQIGSQIINNADVYSNTDFLVRRNHVNALGAALNGLAAALAATPERDTR